MTCFTGLLALSSDRHSSCHFMRSTVVWIRSLVLLALAGAGGALLVLAACYLYLAPQLPAAGAIREVEYQIPLRIYTSDHKLIAEYGEKRREPITYEEVPEPFIQAVLAAEDERFFEHPGVDPKGLLRAAVELLRYQEIRSGGSTITMQVARNFFLDREQRFLRKFNEIVLAMQQDNQPHNFLFTSRHIYVFPKPLERPDRSFDLYPETVGGPELVGSFTVYKQDDYQALSAASTEELIRMNTAPLPSRVLVRPVLNPNGALDFVPSALGAVDDDAVLASSTANRAVSRSPIASSATLDRLPSIERGLDGLDCLPSVVPNLHRQNWPQDRPIARALASNIALV